MCPFLIDYSRFQIWCGLMNGMEGKTHNIRPVFPCKDPIGQNVGHNWPRQPRKNIENPRMFWVIFFEDPGIVNPYFQVHHIKSIVFRTIPNRDVFFAKIRLKLLNQEPQKKNKCQHQMSIRLTTKLKPLTKKHHRNWDKPIDTWKTHQLFGTSQKTPQTFRRFACWFGLIPCLTRAGGTSRLCSGALGWWFRTI